MKTTNKQNSDGLDIGEEEKMKCPNCGFEDSGGRFCSNCGRDRSEALYQVVTAKAPKSNTKAKLVITAIVIIILVGVVLASIPGDNKPAPTSSLEPEKVLRNYYEAYDGGNYTYAIDSTMTHFDNASRNSYLEMMNNQTNPVDMQYSFSIQSVEGIQSANIPVDIKGDVNNLSKNMEKAYRIKIQDSMFLKVTMNESFNGSEIYNATTYDLLQKVDGLWYLSFYQVQIDGWINDTSQGDLGNDFSYLGGSGPNVPPTVTGSIIFATHDSGDWVFYLGSTDKNLSFTDCQLQLEIDGNQSDPVDIPSSLHLIIPIVSGPSTGYSIVVSDVDGNGEISHFDTISIGPINGKSGLNAVQASGASVTLNLILTTTGENFASLTFTV
jgi:hypothetical protein